MRGVVVIVAAVAAASASGLGLGSLGGLDGVRAAIALGVGIIVGLAAWRGVEDEESKRMGPWDIVLLAAWAAASFRAFFWLLYPHGDEWKILSPHNLGDISLHIGLIRYLASGIDFWPPGQILVGEPLTYPMGLDLFNSLLLLVGLDLRSGLVLVGFVLSLCGGYALWKWAGAFGVAAVLVGGGMAGFAIFRGAPLEEFGADSTWKNAFLTMVVPQRGFLYALPAGLTLLWAWQSEFFGRPRRMALSLQVLIYGTMPLFQLHSFLALSVVLALAWVANPTWKPIRLGGLCLLPATTFVLLVTGRFSSGGRIRFDPAWTIGEGGLMGFGIEFGAALAVAVAALVAVVGTGRRDERWMVGGAFVLGMVGFCVPLTDWAWDNTKLLVWAWILIAPPVWCLVLSPLPLVPRSAVCALLFFTGSLALVAGLDRRHGYDLARRSELAAWQRLVAPLPPSAVIAIPPDFNHPVLLLGRRVVCGYEGHLSSHGLDYQEKLALLRRVLTLEPGWQKAAREVGADYVAAGSDSRPVLLPVR